MEQNVAAIQKNTAEKEKRRHNVFKTWRQPTTSEKHERNSILYCSKSGTSTKRLTISANGAKYGNLPKAPKRRKEDVLTNLDILEKFQDAVLASLGFDETF